MLLHTYITQDHYLHLKKDNEELYVHEHIASQQFAVVLLIEVQMKDFSSKPDVSARWVIPARLDHVYTHFRSYNLCQKSWNTCVISAAHLVVSPSPPQNNVVKYSAERYRKSRYACRPFSDK